MSGWLFGQYVPAESRLHRLRPVYKVLCLLAVAAAVFTVFNWRQVLWLTAVVLLIFRAAHLGWEILLHSWRSFALIIVISAVINLFLVPGEPLFHWARVSISRQGMEQGLLLSWQLTILIWLTAIFTATTAPLELTADMAEVLRPLQRIGLPVADLMLALTLAIRFVPVLFEEGQILMKAQRARGASRKISHLAAFIIPLLTAVLRRADELALAMQVRGLQGNSNFMSAGPAGRKRYPGYGELLAAVVLTATWVGVVMLA